MYVLSDAKNGYIYNCKPYYGKQEENPDEDQLKTTLTVIQLCDSLIKYVANPPSKHYIYDDKYESLQLTKELRKKTNVCNRHCHVYQKGKNW